MSAPLDVRDELDRAPLSAAHWRIVVLLGVLLAFDGYDVFAPAYVIHDTMGQWHLTPSQAGLLVSSGLVGFMIGSVAAGVIADRIGRKPTLVAALLLAVLCNPATALWAGSYGSFLALRVATGLGLGVLLPLAVTLVNEMAPARVANLLLGYVMIGWSAGGILAALAGISLIPDFGWPALFWAGGLAILLVPAYIRVLPESPRFLALWGKDEDVRAVMVRLVPGAASRFASAAFAIAEESRHAGSLARLLAPLYRRNTLVVWLCAAFSLFTIFGLSSWVPTVMIARGEGFAASFAFGGLLQLAAVLGGVGCGFAADRLAGRRGTLFLAWLLGAGAITLLALSPLYWTDILGIAVAGFCIMGAQPVLNNLTASLYATEVRGTGVGVELGIGRIGGILGPYAGGWVQQLMPGSAALFLAMAAAVALCVMSLLWLRAPARPSS